MFQFKSLLIDLIHQGGHGLWFISPSCREEKLVWNSKSTSCPGGPADLSTLSKVPIPGDEEGGRGALDKVEEEKSMFNCSSSHHINV